MLRTFQENMQKDKERIPNMIQTYLHLLFFSFRISLYRQEVQAYEKLSELVIDLQEDTNELEKECNILCRV